MRFKDIPWYKRIWFRLRDLDGTWGFFFSFYTRSAHTYALHLDLGRIAFAWNIPEGGEYTWCWPK